MATTTVSKTKLEYDELSEEEEEKEEVEGLDEDNMGQDPDWVKTPLYSRGHKSKRRRTDLFDQPIMVGHIIVYTYMVTKI